MSEAVGIVALAVLAGWLLDVPLLKSLSPGWAAMKPNTAVALLCAAGALWNLATQVRPSSLRRRLWTRTAAGGVTLIGALTLAQILFTMNLGIGGLLLSEAGGAAAQWPGRMSLFAATDFALLGIALLVIAGSSRPLASWVAQLLALSAAFGAFVVMAGYLYGHEQLHLAPFFTGTALHTAMALLALSVGVVCTRPDVGFMALFNADSAGGTLLRRLLIPIVLLPVAINWVELESERRHYLPPDVGWMLDAAVSVLLVGLLVWITARIVHHKDVARAVAETELRESEERYRQLIEMSPNAIIVKDQRRIEFANPAALSLVGAAAPDDMLGKSPFAFLHPEGRAIFEDAICRVVQDGTPLSRMDQRVLRMDGGLVDIELSATPVDYHGRRRAQVVARDITERKHMENALRASVERMQLLARATGDAIWDWDVMRDSTWWSDTFIEKFGYARGTVPTFAGWLEHVHPEDRERATAEFSEAVAKKTAMWSSEYRFRLADGSYGIVFDRAFGICDESGNLVRTVGSMIDISALRRAEEQSRLLSLAVESTSDLISITDLDDRFLFVNRAFLDAYGYTLDEVLDRTPEMLLPAKPESPAQSVAIRSSATELGYSGDLINCRKDGTEFPIHLNASRVLDANGRTVALMGVAQNITEQKRLESELVRHRDHLVELVDARTRELVDARELAEAANEAKSAFLATMSHEIRTPLNGVIAMAEMLALRPLPPQDLDSTESIQRSARNLLAVIDDILDFSKIEAGKLELDLAEMSLRQLADDVSASLHPIATSREVDLSVEVAPTVPALVRGDATRVRQILMNIAGNAIKFSSGRPDLRGRVSVRLEVACEHPLHVVARISDNGIGISREMLTRLFTSFTQAERSTTRRFGGTGLGLAICKRLVELMAGTIEGSSVEGHGSTFTVILPFEAAVQQSGAWQEVEGAMPSGADTDRTARPIVPAAPLGVAEARAQGRLILVAEDDSMNQKVILQQLALLGYLGEIAADGEAALRRWREGSWAMMLTDLHMPKMDGYELVKAVRREEPAGTRLPIIALTANAQRGEAERAASVGMNGYLTKPVPLATLREVLERWIVTRP